MQKRLLGRNLLSQVCELDWILLLVEKKMKNKKVQDKKKLVKLNYNKSFLLLFLKFENKNWLILTVNNNNIFFAEKIFVKPAYTNFPVYTAEYLYVNRTQPIVNVCWTVSCRRFQKKSFRVEEPKRCCVRFNSRFMQMGFFFYFF